MEIEYHTSMAKLTLIGIGQSFRGDDAIGIMAVKAWVEKFPDTANHPDLLVQTAETPGVGLLDMLTEAPVVVLVDAVRSGAVGGTIHRLTENQIASFAAKIESGHGWGVAESLKLGRTLGRDDLPEEIHILGIEGEQFNVGTKLSPSVDEQIPSILDEIQKLVSLILS